MRRQDLRRFDIHLMISILSTFCIGSFIFIILWSFNFIVVQNLSLRFLLWSSYSLFFFIALFVYLATKQPTIIWTKPQAEKETYKKSKYKLESGQSYLIKSKKKISARKVFIDSVNHGTSGMFITRSNPRIIKKKFKLKNTFILWLTEVDANNAINPTDIEDISYTIQKFLKRSENSVILFEGISYLSNVLPFKTMLHFIQDLRDQIALSNSNFLLRLDPDILNPQEISLIEKELKELKVDGI